VNLVHVTSEEFGSRKLKVANFWRRTKIEILKINLKALLRKKFLIARKKSSHFAFGNIILRPPEV
jgi:hypothetical protein